MALLKSKAAKLAAQADAPTSITTRILMNPGKTQVLAQAVHVNN